MNHAPLINSKTAAVITALAFTCPFAQATEGYISTTTAAGTSEVGPTAVYAGQTSAQSSLIAQETARRKAEENKARILLQEGRTAYAEGKYTVALEKYKAAWKTLPQGPATNCLREYIVQVIGDASIAVAIEYSKVGRYDEAEQLLLEVLKREPNNKRARKELSALRDPVRNNPALTPAHVKDVEEVQRLLELGWGYYDLGKFDEADKTFESVLKIDPYNSAARNGQEAVAKRRMNYYRGARNAVRAQALAAVDKTWVISSGEDLPDIELSGGEVPVQHSERQIANAQNLSKMQINNVNFEDTAIEDALDFLRGEARKSGVQINFRFERPVSAPAPSSSSDDEEDEEEEEDSEEEEETTDEAPAAAATPMVARLKVSGVTGQELLQMICDQSGCQYRIEDTGIVVYQTGAGLERMFKRRWKVSRDFFVVGSDEESDDEEDGFEDGPKVKVAKVDAIAALRAAGVSFPKGSSAQYSPRTGMLTVENTADNLDSVEEVVNEYRRKMPQMIKVSARFVEVSQTNEEELSFDWVVNPFSVSNNGTTYLGGVNGYNSTTNRYFRDFAQSGGSAYVNNNRNNGTWPISSTSTSSDYHQDVITDGLMTGGLRSGTGALSGSSMDALVASGSAASNTAKTAAPGILSLSGIYDSGSFQMIMRGLSQKKGVDIMSAPSLVARPGELEYTPDPDPLASDQNGDNGCAKIEVIRRFIYPSAYDAPDISSGGGGGNWGGNNNNDNNNWGGGGMPIASPANPSEWAVEEVGIVMRFKVDEEDGNDIIKFNHFEIRVVNFEGFVNYGSPITAGIANENQIEHITLTENRIDMPIFSRRYINSNPCIYDGHTIAIGGMIEDNVQKVEDKVPVFGDLPLIGRFFRSNAESHVRKNLMIFVTAEKIDPTGKPTRLRDLGTSDAPTAGSTTPSLFPDDGLANP